MFALNISSGEVDELMGMLSLLLLLPLIGILFLLVVPTKAGRAQRVSVIVLTLVVFLFTLYLYTGQENQWKEHVLWLSFGPTNDIAYSLNIDGLSLPLLVLTSLLSLVAAFASLYIKEQTKTYYLLFLLLEFGMLGVFLAANLFVFFLCFEVTLVTMFFLIGMWGYSNKERAAYQFLLYNGLGSAFLFVAIVGIFVYFGTVEYTGLQQIVDTASVSPTVTWTLVSCMLVAFAIKLPVFPFHRWMVLVHVEAPPAVVILHAGVLLKMGAYGLLRFGVGLFPDLLQKLSTLLVIFGLINLLYGAILAFSQQELRRVLAYSSISHMGIVLLGIAAVNTIGLQGALLQTISHGLLSALSFFLVGALYERTKTTTLEDLGGLAKSMPVLSGLLLVAGLGLLGLPGLSGFVSEFFALLGLFEKSPIYAAIGTLGLILAAIYILRAILAITFGQQVQRSLAPDLNWSERLPMFVLIAVIIAIGIYPDLINKTLFTALDWRG
jgi:NADH-quinone oxidoreductase subunit M